MGAKNRSKSGCASLRRWQANHLSGIWYILSFKACYSMLTWARAKHFSRTIKIMTRQSRFTKRVVLVLRVLDIARALWPTTIHISFTSLMPNYLKSKVYSISIIHYTLYIVQYTLYIVQYTLYIVQYTLYIVQCTLYNIHYTLYIVQCTLYNIHYTLYIVQCTLYNIHYALYIVHCTMYLVQYTLYIVQCTLYNIHYKVI